jgi:hypothetical protein
VWEEVLYTYIYQWISMNTEYHLISLEKVADLLLIRLLPSITFTCML